MTQPYLSHDLNTHAPKKYKIQALSEDKSNKSHNLITRMYGEKIDIFIKNKQILLSNPLLSHTMNKQNTLQTISAWLLALTIQLHIKLEN